MNEMTQDMNKTALGAIDDIENRTQMVAEPQSNATQYAANVECPVCHTQNPPSEVYCIDCGFLMSSAPIAVEDMPAAASLGKLVSPDGTREFLLNPGENSVGRENADVLLSNNTVSRRHATIIVESGRAYVEDPGSTNGTFVGGVRVESGQRIELKDGCDVVFGSTNLKYEALAAATQESQAPAEPAGEQTVEVTDEVTTEVTAEQPAEAEAPAEPVKEPVKTPFAKLVAADGSCSFDLYECTHTLGRRQGANDIVIPDPYCSGRHADIKIEDGKIILTDIGSTNGTSINGAKLAPNAPREIVPGDNVMLGQMVFAIELVPQPAEPPASVDLDSPVEPAESEEPGTEVA